MIVCIVGGARGEFVGSVYGDQRRVNIWTDSIQFSPADKPVTYARTLFLMEKLMKLVSTNTRKGGPSAVLYWKNMPVGTASLFVCCGVMVSAHT